jgi:hypothetical protein
MTARPLCVIFCDFYGLSAAGRVGSDAESAYNAGIAENREALQRLG